MAALKAGYAKASANVDQIVENLQAHQITLHEATWPTWTRCLS
ncbi:MAG: hypothetical protein ACLT9P_02425 [Evtepia gabavorous]